MFKNVKCLDGINCAFLFTTGGCRSYHPPEELKLKDNKCSRGARCPYLKKEDGCKYFHPPNDFKVQNTLCPRGKKCRYFLRDISGNKGCRHYHPPEDITALKKMYNSSDDFLKRIKEVEEFHKEVEIKKIVSEYEAKLRHEKQIDVHFYKHDQRYIFGFTVMKDLFNWHQSFSSVNGITYDILKIIWSFVCDTKRLDLENYNFPIGKVCNTCFLEIPDIAKPCCACNDDLFQTKYGFYKEFNVMNNIITLIHKEKKTYRHIHNTLNCLSVFGLINHDFNNCKKRMIGTYIYQDNLLQMYGNLFNCGECAMIHCYNLEHIEIKYDVISLMKPNTVFCNMFPYEFRRKNFDYPQNFNYPRSTHCFKFWNPEEFQDTKSNKNDFYSVVNKRTFDLIMSHRHKHINECIICSKPTVISQNNINLCEDYRCHLTLGVIVIK
jgi:hypothetical protein